MLLITPSLSSLALFTCLLHIYLIFNSLTFQLYVYRDYLQVGKTVSFGIWAALYLICFCIWCFICDPFFYSYSNHWTYVHGYFDSYVLSGICGIPTVSQTMYLRIHIKKYYIISTKHIIYIDNSYTSFIYYIYSYIK